MKFLYADDLHTHLRQGEMMRKVVKYIRSGGCNRVLVMPNTVPEVTTCSKALEYWTELVEIDPTVDYLMTLYLSYDVSVEDLKSNCKRCHVQGIKCYPSGVTTNSDKGFTSLEKYYPLFSEMEKLSLSLHIHGEMPSCSPIYAEKEFLVCRSFPDLKVVLEHVSCSESLDLVKRVHNLGATITPQHMLLTISDVLDTSENVTLDNITTHLKDPFAYCKPLAKFEKDRNAIIETLRTGHPRIFFGSDSAPHSMEKKKSSVPPAGIFSQPFVLQYLCYIFDHHGFLDKLENFCCRNGMEFIGLPPKEPEYLEIERELFRVPEEVDGIVPFRAGQFLNFTISR